jgi:polar amino acid transport system substrate-binding protein
MLTRRQFCSILLLPTCAQAQEGLIKRDRSLVKMAYSLEYAPYSYTQNGKAAGIEVDVASQLFTQHFKLPVQHTIFPWSRAQAKVESGEFDAMFAVPTQERLRYAVASKQAVYHWYVCFFVRKDDHRLDQVHSIEGLKPFKIGVQLGNSWAKEQLKEHNVNYIPAPSSLPAMLLAKRFDVVILDPYVMANLLQNSPLKNQIEELPQHIDQANIHFMMSLRSPFIDLMPRCDDELIHISKSGALAKIRHQHTS